VNNKNLAVIGPMVHGNFTAWSLVRKKLLICPIACGVWMLYGWVFPQERTTV